MGDIDMNSIGDAILIKCPFCDDEVMAFPKCEVQQVEAWSKQIKVGVYLVCEECNREVTYDYRWIELHERDIK